MKRRKLADDDDELKATILPIDNDKCGEDFHNPMYDSKLVHPLGRFNQSFALFRATHIDIDTLEWCKKQVGRKRGPFASPNELPLETKFTESLVTALENLKAHNSTKDLHIPTLFVLTAQNFEGFQGETLDNYQKEVLLQNQF